MYSALGFIRVCRVYWGFRVCEGLGRVYVGIGGLLGFDRVCSAMSGFTADYRPYEGLFVFARVYMRVYEGLGFSY